MYQCCECYLQPSISYNSIIQYLHCIWVLFSKIKIIFFAFCWCFRNFMKFLLEYFRNFLKLLKILGISLNHWPNQEFREITEIFRNFAKLLVTQLYCNIYIFFVKNHVNMLWGNKNIKNKKLAFCFLLML